MFKNLCYAISGIDDLINAQGKGEEVSIENNSILNTYCPSYIPSEGGQCIGHSAALISAFIGLLKIFENHDVDASEKDKLTQYAILWLSYKLKKYMKMEDGISDIYENIKHNNNKISEYDNYKEQIKKLMDMDIKDISKFYDAIEILCKMYTEFDDDTKNCTNCSQNAEKFVKTYKELNDNSNHTDGSSYSQLLHTLSNDYENLKNNCTNFPPLSQLTPQKRSAQNPGHTSEAISSNSSIASTLIPVSSIFAAIPIFLGIAYKYSLFGIDKLLQRQYLRKKLKKIKKKMEHYI